jgi:hypothetical protein
MMVEVSSCAVLERGTVGVTSQLATCVCVSMNMRCVRMASKRRCHISGGWSLDYQRGGPGSIPGPSVLDLWRTEWQWLSVFREFFGFTVSLIIPYRFVIIHSPGGGQWAC